MGIKSGLTCSGGAANSNVGGVNKYIDTAFDDIQKVANNLEKLLELNSTYQNLQGVYLGAYASTPTLRNNGDALENGDHYLNTVTSLLYVHLDGNWIYHSIFYTQSALNQAVGQGPFNIWIAYADDSIGTNISLNPSGKSYTGMVNNKDTSVVDISDETIFTWAKTIGVDGITSYIHIAYADSSNGFTNFNTTTGSYLGVYVDTLPTDSIDPNMYNWNIIKGSDGLDATGIAGADGTSVIVTDLGGGRISISDGNSTVYLDDGEIPTLIDNGDGTFTITSGLESVTVSDGVTPLIGIDYFDGNNGDYISFIYGNVVKGSPAPTIDSGTGTWNGTVETYPTGSITWLDNANFVDGMTTYMSQNRYKHTVVTNTWELRNTNWASPTIFIDKPDDASQGQIKAFAFIRNAVSPVTSPTGGNFISPTPTTGGWVDGIPAGTLPIWVVTAVFTSDGLAPQNVGSPVIWSVPQLFAENGSGFKHRFSANQTGPWSDTPQTTDEWMITSVRDSAGIWVDDTANPIRIKGETGATQQTSLRSFAFKRSTDTLFNETPTGGTFLSPNPVDGVISGWTDGIPAGTARLYVSTRTFTSDGLAPQQTVWAASQVFSYNGEGYRTRFSIDGVTLWHLGPAADDVFMWPQTSADGGVTWVDIGTPIKIKGESALGNVDIDFSPGFIGGAGDFIFTLNAVVGGATDIGEIRIQGSTYTHPDGNSRTLQPDSQVTTPYGEGTAGRFYLMWTDESNVTRFGISIGGSTNIVPIRINSTNSGWEVFDNAGVVEAFTPLVTDVIIASVQAYNTTGGLTGIIPLVSGTAGSGSIGDTGASGNSVAQLTIYIRASSAPTTPTGGSFSFDTQLITPPTGWSAAPISGTGDLYASTAIASTVGTTGSDTSIPWGSPDIMASNGTDGVNGSNGITGNSVYQGNIYIRSLLAPNTPTANSGSFNFTTNVLTPPTGWSSSPPAGEFPLYVSTSTFSIAGITGTDSTQTWTVPVMYVQDGLDAFSNLVDPTEWVVGNTGSQGNFIQNGATDENTVVLGIGPHNVSEAIWESVSNIGDGSGGDGGWTNYIDANDGYDPSKSYRSVVWIKQSESVGTVYLGCSSCFNLSGTVNTNPYFWSGDLPTNNKWYLVVGILHGASYTGVATNISGVYDPDTGLKVISGTDYLTNPATTTQRHRAYLYYSNSLTNKISFARPRFDELNGNEPSLADVIGRLGEDGSNGLSTYMYNIFRRSASALSTPTGGSFDFGNNNGSPPSSWFNTPPSGTDPLYIATSLASVVGNTGVDAGLTWSAPVIFAQDGVIGPTGAQGIPGTDGIDGSNGTNGTAGIDGLRGTKHYYTTTTGGVWSDSIANNFITAQGDTRQQWDIVTISDTGNGFSQTRYWTGTVWSVISAVIDGNLIVIGTIAANKIMAGSITASQIAAGTITANEIATNSITSNEMAANSITATEINVSSLSAVSATMGTVTGGTFRTGVSGYRTEISDIGNYPIWFGTGTKNDANGVFYIKTDGTAVFKGDLSASGGTFSGDISGSTGTFSGDISAANGTFTGNLSGSTINGSTINGARVDALFIDSVSIYAKSNGTFFGQAGYSTAIYGWSDAAFSIYSTVNIGVRGKAATKLGIGPIDAIGVLGESTGSTGSGRTSYGVEGNASAAGGFDFYASGAGSNYGPFTGSHQGLVSNSFVAESGDIVCDLAIIAHRGLSNAIISMDVSTAPMQRNVRGIYLAVGGFSKEKPPSALSDLSEEELVQIQEDYQLINFNGVGEGMMNVIGEGGDMVSGDLICSSSTSGKGMKQSDQAVERPYTIAQIRHSISFTDTTEEKQVAVIYLRG